MYTIGKLSKHTGVTVRTLDYYDEIGLLEPPSRTSGGHRLYNDEDVMRLERILALKYMGFTLEQIKENLETSTSTWRQSLQQQLDMVKREQARLQTLEQALLGVFYSIEFEGAIKWPIVFNIIKLYQQDPEEALEQYKAYLNKEEMEKIMAVTPTQMCEEDIKEWMGVISEIKNNLNTDPNSEKAGELVKRWMNQVENMFGKDEELLGNMRGALKNLQEGIAFYPMNQDVINFIERVFNAQAEK